MLTVPGRYHERHRHRAYGLSCAQFDELFIAANGRCEICRERGEDTPHGVLFVDHDYDLGMHGVRGLLCNRCNTLLGIHGAFSPAAAAYLGAPWHNGRRRPHRLDEISAQLVIVRRMLLPKES